MNLGTVGSIEQASGNTDLFPALFDVSEENRLIGGAKVTNKPNFVGMWVPAVCTMGDLKGTHQAAKATALFKTFPGRTTAEPREGITLTLFEFLKAVKRLVRKRESHHARPIIIGIGPGDQLGKFDSTALLDERTADRTGPNAATGSKVAVVGRLVHSAKMDPHHSTSTDIAAIVRPVHITRLATRVYDLCIFPQDKTGNRQSFIALCTLGLHFQAQFGGGGRRFRSITKRAARLARRSARGRAGCGFLGLCW
ncbi:MAG: hypothetical protein A3J25_03880 [Pseudomonadales bacterium RIFCSPLOWO2_02_FULL_63_210]|nr:MAG: hypothetical protein A3J25_03880 [Pseudomonadales bacterium RIFCSPLOWO2_02_FULL_63_210]